MSTETDEERMSKWGEGRAVGSWEGSWEGQLPESAKHGDPQLSGLASGEWISVVFVTGKVRTV